MNQEEVVLVGNVAILEGRFQVFFSVICREQVFFSVICMEQVFFSVICMEQVLLASRSKSTKLFDWGDFSLYI